MEKKNTLFKNTVYTRTNKIAPISPPIHPSIVFLGLISENLCFPKYFPTK